MTLPNASDDDTAGRTAYNAYADAVGGKSINGDPIPKWEENDNQRVKDAWEIAGKAVLDRFADDVDI